MKVLVTGASGNFGSHLLPLLKSSGHEVVAVTRKNWNQLESLMPGVDIVVHAAYDLKHTAAASPTAYMESNILATAGLLEISAMHGIKKIYFISSCAVYANNSNFNEKSLCAPASVNGQIKLLNEGMVSSFCSENNLDYTILRVFNMYGGNDQFSILHKLKETAQGEGVFNLNNQGVSQRDFVHVDDVSKIVTKIIDMRLPEKYFNIGSGKSTRIGDLVDIVHAKYPDLHIATCSLPEVEYSRADTSLLLSYFDYKFKEVMLEVRKI
ncbi:MAG: NAD(P)-dependent oxidoreductase [Mariprofundaceae bacterium]